MPRTATLTPAGDLQLGNGQLVRLADLLAGDLCELPGARLAPVRIRIRDKQIRADGTTIILSEEVIGP